jgi:MFS superfamily sulfate permease-like transporter
MAYATVAGLPVSVGLYTAFVPMIVYAFLGTSRVLSVSGDRLGGIALIASLVRSFDLRLPFLRRYRRDSVP